MNLAQIYDLVSVLDLAIDYSLNLPVRPRLPLFRAVLHPCQSGVDGVANEERHVPHVQSQRQHRHRAGAVCAAAMRKLVDARVASFHADRLCAGAKANCLHPGHFW